MDILTIDFETYYAKDYGLRKFTLEEYIRADKFEVIGVAVKVSNADSAGESVWCTGSKQKVKAFLDSFDWGNSAAIAHNAMFDMAILNWHFDIRPKKIIDTLSMARAIHTVEVGGSLDALTTYYNLGKKGTEVNNALGKRRLDFTEKEMQAYGGYCIQDVDLTYKLFQVLIKRVPIFELDLIDLTMRMFTEPAIVLDKEVLEAHLVNIVEEKAALMARVTHDRKQLTSNPQFAALLESYGVVPPTKISLTTGKVAFAFAKTDEEFKKLSEHENPEVQTLVAARLGIKSTIEETRTARFIGIASRGLLPVPLRYYAAHTGRWGGDDKINMQNLTRGSQLKYAMRAPEGFSFIDCDLSQIEARMLAWLAGEEVLVDAFMRGDDVYKIMASSIYGKPVEEITKEERFVGKTTILGCGYGMGAVRFQAQLKTFHVDLELEECERIIKVYRKTYPAITKLWSDAGKALKTIQDDKTSELGRGGALIVDGEDGILLPNGLYVSYPNLRVDVDEDGNSETVYDTLKGRTLVPTRIYGGKVIENVCQALSRIVIGGQLLAVSKEYKVVMTVHDAIGALAPTVEVGTAMQRVEELMKIRPEWAPDLPLDCEGGYGESYGSC
tara:strand:- start:406 stop:2241 length:1836 start_codon:yes stop_codon:yes gene_type:complete